MEFQLAWFANPLYWVAISLLATKKYTAATWTAAVAVLLPLDTRPRVRPPARVVHYAGGDIAI
jgi:hypothetical protein